MFFFFKPNPADYWMRWQGMMRAFWKVTLYSIIMIPLKRSQLWKQVVKLSNVLCGIMKNYDLSLKGKGVFFLTTLLEFNNSLPDILIYLFANIHRSSIDLVIKHLTRVNGNKVCRKKNWLFFIFLSSAAVIWLLWPSCLLTKSTSVVEREEQALPFYFAIVNISMALLGNGCCILTMYCCVHLCLLFFHIYFSIVLFYGTSM